MKTQKPKISFNVSPERPVNATHEPEQFVAPEYFEDTAAFMRESAAEDMYEPEHTREFEPAPALAPQPMHHEMHQDGFDRAEWEEGLTAPQPEPVPMPTAKHRMQHARLAALGQMPKRQSGFLERNINLLGVAAVIGATVVFGLGSAMWLFGGDETRPTDQATFSAQASETATRALLPDMTDVSDAATPVATPSPSDLTAAVLAGLQPQSAAPVEPEVSIATTNRDALDVLNNDKVRMLREGVLADMYDIETYQQADVTRVRLRTFNAPLVSEQASDAVLNAVSAGEIEMSQALMTTQGTVDVETMMFNLVQVSLRSDHSSIGMNAAHGMSRKIFAASKARTQNVEDQRVYIVQAGDSLAYIALQFYGSPNVYDRILEANRSILQSPEQIQTGQRLVIPS